MDTWHVGVALALLVVLVVLYVRWASRKAASVTCRFCGGKGGTPLPDTGQWSCDKCGRLS
jgi:ribosomal protein L37AE/L43A